MHVHQFRAMNSDIVLMADGHPSSVLEGFEAAESFIHASEKRFTRFSKQSELAQLNQSAGSWFQASPNLFELVCESLNYFQKTNGLFDPSILPDLMRAGYDRTLDEVQRLNSDPQPASRSMRSSPTLDMVELNAESLSIRLPTDLQIDLGGIAKGWIAEHAARLMSQCATSCAASAGGDMFLIGYPEGQDYWEVGLEDPRNIEEDITILRVGEGAIATSSVSKRVWRQGTLSRHHLIDPRSHEPVISDWLSVTVIAPEMPAAETYAKAALIGGMDFARGLIQKNPKITMLAVDKNGQLIDIQEEAEHVH